MKKNYRYPGTRPFQENDSNLFFGRTLDIEKLYNRIFVEKITVLHGKSGLGKTSLLQAGILPKLRTESDYQNVAIRFTAYQEGYSLEPVQVLLNNLPKIAETTANFLAEDDSLWATFKKLQLAGKKHFILFFDQFEELFTYPDLSVRLFKNLFSELINGNIPKKTNKILQDLFRENKLSESEMNLLLEPLDLKVVFAIRSDRMSLLDRLADKIPSILRNLYELKALETAQAQEALLLPAQLKGDFITEVFEYEAAVVKNILNYLSKNNTQKIESFQLQIFCQWAENFSHQRKDYLIESHDIGDPNLIFENYYENQIQTLPKTQQETARKLLEDDLIYEKEERRLSLYEGVILDKIGDRALLDLLVNTRLLRAEPVQDGFAYEISHDTLVAPILKAKKVRVAELLRQAQERKQAEELRLQNLEREKELAEKRKIAQTLRTTRTLLAVAFVALVLAIVAVFYAFEQKNEADAQTKIAKTKEQEAVNALKVAYKSKIQELENTKSVLESDGRKPQAQEYQQKIDSIQILIKKLE